MKEELMKLGTGLQYETYFLDLATKLANTYKKTFPINNKNFLENGNKLLETRISLDNFSEQEKAYLMFEDDFKLSLDSSSYILINLKGMTERIVFDNEEYFSSSLDINMLYALLDSKRLSYDKNAYFNFLDKLYLTSLIYNYAYNILLENAHSNNELAIAGMFRNAYYDIIEISKSKTQNRAL